MIVTTSGAPLILAVEMLILFHNLLLVAFNRLRSFTLAWHCDG